MTVRRKGRGAPAVATQPRRALEVSVGAGPAYPTAAELLASGALDALADVLRAVLCGGAIAGAALGAGGCGTAGHAGAQTGPVAVLAPLAQSAPAKGGPETATLVPLPPPPPLPGTTPPEPPAPPLHRVRPPVVTHHLGGAIRAPHPYPTPVSGGMGAVDVF